MKGYDPYNSRDDRRKASDVVEFEPQEIAAMPAISPRYPLAFPESTTPEVVREDVRNAVIEALSPPKTAPASVTLPPLELEF